MQRILHALHLLACCGLLGLGSRAKAQPACFRSIPEAAAQSGSADSAGFRIDSLHHDAFSGVTWAAIVNCAHPERPAVLVKSVATNPSESPKPKLVNAAALVLAGSEVRLLRIDASARVELQGVALTSGASGDRVRVRLQAALAGAAEQFVTGLVRPDGTLELED